MHISRLAAPILALPLMLAAAPAQATDKYLSEIFAMPGSYCPEGSLDADGRELSIRDFQALYSIIGNSYGGDGAKTFALPDLRPDKKPLRNGQLRQCIVVSGGDYPVHSD